MPETAKRTARVPILGENGRISDDYVPEAIGQGVQSAQDAAAAAELAKTGAETARDAAVTAKDEAEAAKTGAERFATNAVAQAQAAKDSADAARGSASQAASSASQAAASAQTASQKADAVLDHYIASATATTLEPGSDATATVANKVLQLGIPRGDKGDKGDKGDPGDVSAVTTAEGSDLSVSTDGGTVTIDDSALRERIAELENQAANVVTGTSTGLVAHGEDAFHQKPREVRIKGKTRVNRWPVLSGTNNGITVATDETGLVTVTGTATADADVTADVSRWATGKSYTTMISAAPTGCSAYFEVQKPSGNTSINATTTGATLNVASDATNCVAGVHVTSGTTVNTSFRVMLVDGTEAPDCFTPPASITSVQPGNLVTSGKNLFQYTKQVVLFFTGGLLQAGTYTMSLESLADWWTNNGGNGRKIFYYMYDNLEAAAAAAANGTPLKGFSSSDSVDFANADVGVRSSATLTLRTSGCILFVAYYGDTWIDQVTDIQLELGSTATAYEPPAVTTTPLPEVELRSLPNGTCDELVIKADGTCEVERRTQTMSGDVVALDTPTTEPQSPVTLPALPAPTFNQYHDSPVPSDTSTEYARDINIVLDKLQAQISATTVREATNG